MRKVILLTLCLLFSTFSTFSQEKDEHRYFMFLVGEDMEMNYAALRSFDVKESKVILTDYDIDKMNTNTRKCLYMGQKFFVEESEYVYFIDIMVNKKYENVDSVMVELNELLYRLADMGVNYTYDSFDDAVGVSFDRGSELWCDVYENMVKKKFIPRLYSVADFQGLPHKTVYNISRSYIPYSEVEGDWKKKIRALQVIDPKKFSKPSTDNYDFGGRDKATVIRIY